jgi:hypothetical protein
VKAEEATSAERALLSEYTLLAGSEGTFDTALPPLRIGVNLTQKSGNELDWTSSSTLETNAKRWSSTSWRALVDARAQSTATNSNKKKKAASLTRTRP